MSTRVPSTMHAAFVRELGGPDLIEYAELPTPSPAPTEVLVRVEASAVNHVDLFVRSGAYRTPTPFPFVIGRDLVGRVVAIGDGVDAFERGQRVWCNSLGHGGRQGAFAEYAAVPVERLYPLPDLPAGADAGDVAAVLHPAATAFLGLVREARLVAGETVYVGGAAGGVGSAVVGLATALGARVIATAAPRDHGWCRRCGADTVLDYHDPGLADAVAAAAPDGVDVWWNTSGHDDLGIGVPLLARHGRIIASAGMTATAALPIGALYTRDARILGFTMSGASAPDLAAAARTINPMLAAGRLPVRIARELPLADAARAHRMQEDGVLHGRIVVRPG